MKKAGSIIKQYFECRNIKGETESLNYTGIWKRITGKNIERYTRPVALKNGTLFIEVEDSVWLYQLTLLKDKILLDFNTFSGDIKIKDIVFSNKGFSLSGKVKEKIKYSPLKKKDSNVQEQKITAEELSRADLNEIDNLVGFIPESYQEKTTRLLSSFFRLQNWKEKKGAKKCIRCRSLFINKGSNDDESGLCHICHREKLL